MVAIVVDRRVQKEIELQKKQRLGNNPIYFPKDTYKVKQVLLFPHLDWKLGTVIQVREGYNPSLPSFTVIRVQFENGEEKELACGIEEHILNKPPVIEFDEQALDVNNILFSNGNIITEKIQLALEQNEDFINIANDWFPRTLLADFNLGQLNIAEATLDMANCEPLSTAVILDHLDADHSINLKLAEFSLNYHLQQDTRFDEVGASGEILWFLRRLEPKAVQEKPLLLRYQTGSYDRAALKKEFIILEQSIDDELTSYSPETILEDKVHIKLIYPHWRNGSLPLTPRVQNIFPTAYEAPRIRFWFVDAHTKARFPAWVVRQEGYIYGLEQWYAENGLMSGSIIHLSKGAPGEVIIHTGNQRSSRDYLRTVLVGSDGGIVFAMLRQLIKAEYDERMAFFIPDQESLDQVWQKNIKDRPQLDTIISSMMRNLAKLTPQAHVHATEIYAAVNLVFRSPPGKIFTHLLSNPQFSYVGDLYFHQKDND